MEIKPVRTKADYRAMLKEVATLMSARAQYDRIGAQTI